VIKVHQGEVTMERTRTRRKATEYLLRQVEKLGALERVALIHSHAPIELFSTFTQQVCQNFHLNGNLISAEVTPTIGAHVGPAAVGVVVVAA
jgi:fatty acid-binding protein DegV